MLNSDHSVTWTGDTAVRLENVTKKFLQKVRHDSLASTLRGLFNPRSRPVHALAGVSFEVRRGEILAYAGANGAGKSTTIRLISGLLAPDQGRVQALGLDPLRQRIRHMQRTGVLFGQRTELWWDQPLITSYEWKKVVWNIPENVYRRMLSDLVELLDMSAYLHTQVRELSLGQRMRGDLAMALLHEPDLLLLDEPTLGMDVLAKRQVIGFLKEMNRRGGTTVIVTSHDMDDLMEMAGRIILLDRGHIIYDGGFESLRLRIGGLRTLILTTHSDQPLELTGAVHQKSEGNRHWYTVDGEKTPIISLLRQVPEEVLSDVETMRPPFEQQIAELYRDSRIIRDNRGQS